MREQLTPAIGTGLLLGVVVALAAIAVTQMSRGAVETAQVSEVDTIQMVSEAVAPPSVNFPNRPEVYFNAVIERPLFAPGRRPSEPVQDEAELPTVEPEANPVVNEPTLPPNVQLHGISGHEYDYSALLSMEGGAPQWIKQGASLDKWRLSSVGADWIILENGENSLRVELYK